MKKVQVIIASIGLLILYLSSERLLAHFDPGVLGVELLPMDSIYQLCEEKEMAFIEPEITINGDNIAYDEAQNMLLIPQNLSEAEFMGKLKVPDGTLYFAEDEAFSDKGTAIAENRVFRLFWLRETGCWMYNVYFTGMPVLWITSETVDEEEISYGKVEIYDPYQGSNKYQSTTGNWHLRGATTLKYEKKSYRLTIDEKLSFLGMRKDDDWILHALYDDDGLIHNKLSYEVWQEIALNNHVNYDEGISMEYVELFRDREYLGVYGLTERIDEKELNLNSNDILYKCREHQDPGEDDFYTELTEEMEPSFVQKYPDEITEENWGPLKQWTDWYCFEEAVEYEDGKALLNMENAIDYALFNLLICGDDNSMKNIYFWADYQMDGSYQFIKVPWDLNMTWGNSWVEDFSLGFNQYQEKNLTRDVGWTPDLYTLYEMNPQEIGEAMYERWQELRKDIITKEALYEKADTQFAYLNGSGAYVREQIMWPEKGVNWSSDYIYQYIDKRIDFLDEYISQLATGE